MTTLNLREQRQALGLTLQDLAKQTGIQVGNLSRVERGKEFLRPARARKLAAALNLPESQVYAALFAAHAQCEPVSQAGDAEAVPAT